MKDQENKVRNDSMYCWKIANSSALLWLCLARGCASMYQALPEIGQGDCQDCQWKSVETRSKDKHYLGPMYEDTYACTIYALYKYICICLCIYMLLRAAWICNISLQLVVVISLQL